MVILFLIALLLAWPTAGLSIIAYVAYAVLNELGKGELDEKALSEPAVKAATNRILSIEPASNYSEWRSE